MKREYVFIDSTKSDRLTKRRARSHAMKGKNAGKTLHRRSILDLNRLRGSERVDVVQDVRSRDVVGTNIALMDGLLGLTYKTLGDQLFSISFPVEATTNSQNVINQFLKALYPEQLCRSLEQTKSYWLRTLFFDKTSYHCSLALMATLNEFFFGKIVVSSKSIYHLNQAVSMVNQSLQTSEALSDSNLAVVNFFIVQELLRGAKSTAEVHLKGLEQMVKLRGGLSQLGDKNLLVLKICKTDIDCALHYGTSTYFYWDHMPDVALALASEGFFMNENFIKVGSRFHGINPFLEQILLDVMSIASLFNTDSAEFRLDPHMLQEIVVSVGCRLIQFQPLGGPRLENRRESACHIGLTAFLTTLFVQFGGRCFMKYDLVAQSLKDVIERGLDDGDDDIMLWLLFIGGISVLGDCDQPWLILRIQQAMQSNIVDWAVFHQSFIHFPWINSLHDEAGQALWDSSRRNVDIF